MSGWPARCVNHSSSVRRLSPASRPDASDAGAADTKRDSDARARAIDGLLRLLDDNYVFPDMARATQGPHLAELAAYTGWRVRIWPHVHQEALMQAARAALPAGLTSSGAPALQSATREVVLRVQGDAAGADLAAAAAQFQATTGWQLVLRGV